MRGHRARVMLCCGESCDFPLNRSHSSTQAWPGDAPRCPCKSAVIGSMCDITLSCCQSGRAYRGGGGWVLPSLLLVCLQRVDTFAWLHPSAWALLSCLFCSLTAVLSENLPSSSYFGGELQAGRSSAPTASTGTQRNPNSNSFIQL